MLNTLLLFSEKRELRCGSYYTLGNVLAMRGKEDEAMT